MPATQENCPQVYVANQPCRVCKRELGSNHKFSVCELCIVKEAKKHYSGISSYEDVLLKVNSTIRWRVWRDLKIHNRKPVGQ